MRLTQEQISYAQSKKSKKKLSPLGLWCETHDCKLFVNKSGTAYHTGAGHNVFCYGNGYKDFNKKKEPTT